MLFQNAVVDTALWQKTSSLTLQIWYIIPADKEAAFLQYIRETIPNGVGLSYIKQLLPQIPRAQMAALGAVRIVQEPGQAVITCPVGPLACRCVSAGCKRPHVLHSIKSLEGLQVVQGLVFHFTLSCGTSEAEATNFYLDSPDTTFVDIWRRWCRYARESQRCDPFQMYVCTYLISTGSQSSHHSQHAPTQDLSLLPRPHTTSHQRPNLVADDRNHVAWTIGQWMEVGHDTSRRARDHLTLLHFESALGRIGPTDVRKRRKRHHDV